MRKSIIIMCALIIPLFIAGSVFSEIRVVEVSGKVAYKDGGSWKALRKGQTLNEGVKISTGVKSSAVIELKDGTVKVRELTMMKIYSNRAEKDTTRTNIGLKYGSINAKVKKIKNLKTIFKISTPVATSSVRGTEQDVSYGSKSGMVIVVINGEVMALSKETVAKVLSGNYTFTQKSDSVKPENLLTNVQNNAFVRIYDVNISGDEKVTVLLFNDIIDSSDFISDVSNIISQQQSALVRVKLQWPGGTDGAAPQ